VKAVKPDKSEEQAAALIEACSEVLKLRAQLKRTEEERDILKRPPGTLLRNPSKVPIHQRSAWPVQDDNVVPSTRRFPQRLLSVVEQTALGPRD